MDGGVVVNQKFNNAQENRTCDYSIDDLDDNAAAVVGVGAMAHVDTDHWSRRVCRVTCSKRGDYRSSQENGTSGATRMCRFSFRTKTCIVGYADTLCRL